jgi:hypothetical protein
MMPGKGGLFGGGMYFAATPEIAMYKQAKDGFRMGAAILLTVLVDFGDALVIEGSAHNMTNEILNARGCQSVFGRQNPASGWEYVVYDSDRIIEFVNLEIKNPDAQKYKLEGETLHDELQKLHVSRPCSLADAIAALGLAAPDEVRVDFDMNPQGPPGLSLKSLNAGPIKSKNFTLKDCDVNASSPMEFDGHVQIDGGVSILATCVSTSPGTCCYRWTCKRAR